jgi:hypothetical protein
VAGGPGAAGIVDGGVEAGVTPNNSASISTTAVLARSSTGGAATRTFTASP